jgi:8-oxo-dGTP diphosphatase
MPEKPYALSVKVLIRDDRGRCLLLRRAAISKNNAGMWDLPGGKVDPGEAIDAALVREVAEECGVTISVDCVLGATESETPTKKVVYVIFGGHRLSGDVRLSEEHDDLRWVSREDLPQTDLCTPFRPFAQSYCGSASTP